MPAGGALTIETPNAEVGDDDPAIARRPLRPLVVRDTGVGMTPGPSSRSSSPSSRRRSREGHRARPRDRVRHRQAERRRRRGRERGRARRVVHDLPARPTVASRAASPASRCPSPSRPCQRRSWWSRTSRSCAARARDARAVGLRRHRRRRRAEALVLAASRRIICSSPT